MKTLLTLLLASGFALGTAIAQPQGRGQGQGPQGHRGEMQADVFEQLDLTEDQAAALKDARYSMQAAMIGLRADQKTAQLELHKLQDADAVDREALMKAIEAESDAELAIKKAMADHMLSVREIIGADKAKQIRKRMRAQRSQHRGGPSSNRGGQGHGNPDRQPFN